MKKDLPIYDIKLSDDTQGVGFISLVDEPAIGVDWIKLAKQEPIELFMSLTGDGLCFGCPPNGDGTRVNGEPDARCKGDGSGKTAGTKGGSKTSSSEKSFANNRQKLESFENGRWDKDSEDGLFVLNGEEVKGIIVSRDARSVSVNATTLQKLGIKATQQISFTHNHPSGGGFSDNDLSTMLVTGVGETRAVGTEKVNGVSKKVVYEVRGKGRFSDAESNRIAKEYKDFVVKNYRETGGGNTLKQGVKAFDSIHEGMLFITNKYPNHFYGYKRTYIK